MMTSTKLIRWSGIPCMLAGVLYALAVLIHPAGEGAASIASAFWVPAHAVGAMSAVLLLFGLMGVYGRQAAASGPLMLIGFVLASVGTMLLASEEIQAATLMPVIAANAPALIEGAASTGAITFGIAILLSFFLGFLLLGIATLRLKMLPRWAAVLLLLGLVLSLGGSALPVVGLLAAVAFSLGLAWMGFALWTEKPAAA